MTFCLLRQLQVPSGERTTEKIRDRSGDRGDGRSRGRKQRRRRRTVRQRGGLQLRRRQLLQSGRALQEPRRRRLRGSCGTRRRRSLVQRRTRDTAGGGGVPSSQGVHGRAAETRLAGHSLVGRRQAVDDRQGGQVFRAVGDQAETVGAVQIVFVRQLVRGEQIFQTGLRAVRAVAAEKPVDGVDAVQLDDAHDGDDDADGDVVRRGRHGGHVAKL